MPDYFIRTGGNDALDGLSDGNAWASWAKVVTWLGSAANTAPGDRYQFRRGDTFSAVSALIPNEAGTAVSPITIGAYGTGAKPIVNSSTIVGGTIYTGFSHITVENLELVGPGKAITTLNSSGIRIDSTAAYCRILDCKIREFPNYGSSLDGDDWTIMGSEISAIGAHGIIGGDLGDRGTLKTSSVFDWGGNSTYESGGRHGIYMESLNGKIYDCDFYSPTAGVSGQAVSIRKNGQRVFRNKIHDCPYAMAFFNYDATSVSNLTPGYLWAYGNRCYNLTNFGFYIDGSPPAVRVGGPGSYQNTVDIAILNNSFHFSGGGAADYAIAMDAATPNIDASTRIVNNAIWGTPGKYLLLSAPTRAGKALLEKKNLFLGATQANPFSYGGVLYATLAAYQAGSGQGVGDLNSDPLRSDAGPNMIPTKTSPDLQLGATDGEVGVVYTAV